MSALSQATEFLQVACDDAMETERSLGDVSSECDRYANALGQGGLTRAARTVAMVGGQLGDAVAILSTAVSQTKSTLGVVGQADAANLDDAAKAVGLSNAQLSTLQETVRKATTIVEQSADDISALGSNNTRLRQIRESLHEVKRLCEKITSPNDSPNHALDDAQTSLDNEATGGNAGIHFDSRAEGGFSRVSTQRRPHNILVRPISRQCTATQMTRNAAATFVAWVGQVKPNSPTAGTKRTSAKHS